VCELEGPTPILKISNALTAMAQLALQIDVFYSPEHDLWAQTLAYVIDIDTAR
jgi:hypothetical protein